MCGELSDSVNEEYKICITDSAMETFWVCIFFIQSRRDMTLYTTLCHAVCGKDSLVHISIYVGVVMLHQAACTPALHVIKQMFDFFNKTVAVQCHYSCN